MAFRVVRGNFGEVWTQNDEGPLRPFPPLGQPLTYGCEGLDPAGKYHATISLLVL
jgi:hypothetical protein